METATDRGGRSPEWVRAMMLRAGARLDRETAQAEREARSAGLPVDRRAAEVRLDELRDRRREMGGAAGRFNELFPGCRVDFDEETRR